MSKKERLELYVKMDAVMSAWLHDFRDMVDDEDDITQAICDLSHAYYWAVVDRNPKKFKKAYEEWLKANAHLLNTKKGSEKGEETPLTGSFPPSSTLPYPPPPETE